MSAVTFFSLNDGVLVVNLSRSCASWERAVASPFFCCILELKSNFSCAYFRLLLCNRAGGRQDFQASPGGPEQSSIQMTAKV